ncbi:MAG: TIGR01777 family oxidoreductase [Planctomycetota bacterium]
MKPAAARFHRSLELEADAETVFRWHCRAGAFERLVPPWEEVRLDGPAAPIEEGARQTVTFPLGPLRARWSSEITSVTPGTGFRDVQLSGPFASWEHAHSMRPAAGGRSSVLEDSVRYELPLGRLGSFAAGRFVRRKLDRMFAYRHRVTARDLARHAAVAAPPADVLVTGASGMVGRSLASFLTTGGHRVRRLVRGAPRNGDEFRWDPERGELDPAALEGVHAVVHLAGENIAGRRWSEAQKARIRASRVAGTRLLVDAMRRATRPPRAFVCASAVGIYGDRGDELLAEDSAKGEGFLAEVCEQWEAEARRADGVRSVQLRFGVVLSPAGGALAKMLLPFRLGLGGRIGDGRQWMSWIALDDAVGAIHHALFAEGIDGPVNAVAPQAVTNAEYTRTLGRVLRRPTVLPMPAFAARLAFGELANELLLASQRVQPRRLRETGYDFAYPELEGALRHQLGC